MKAALALAALVAASACLSAPQEPFAGPLPLPPAPALPPGCNATRPAVAHGPAPTLPLPSPVPCASYTGRASFEPNVAVAADGTVFLYPAADLGLPSPVSLARSRDAGATWTFPTPDLLGQPTHPYSEDPHMFLDPATGRLFAEDLLLVPPTCGMMSITDDLGEGWTHTQSGCGVADHVTLFSGASRLSQTRGYPNLIYRCGISGGALAGFSTMVACQRSTDGGLTWLPPGAPAFVFPPGVAQGAGGCSGGNGHGATTRDGRVLLPRGHCGQPWLAVSDDEAQTWRAVQVSDLGTVCDADLCEHDAGVGEDTGGTLYYAWVAADRHPYLARSRDGGATWAPPVPLGPPELVEAALLQLAVGGRGRIAAVYYATTSSPGPPWTGSYQKTDWDARLTISWDADSESPAFRTVTLNDPADPLVRGRCGPVRCQEVFDYIDVRIGPDGTPWASLVDGCFDGCEPTNTDARGLVGRAWGGASLWDDADPNGPFPDARRWTP